MPRDHALLSPSSAHRWLECTPSARLEMTVADKASVYTDEGTLAHALCASILKWRLGESTSDERATMRELSDAYLTAEMRRAAKDYADLVWGKFSEAKESTPDARLFIETELDLKSYIPDGFGTSDAVIIADGTMEVIDYKFGKGVRVSAENNPQMKIYALGAYDRYSLEYRITKVRMTIVQPRLDSVSEWETSVDDLVRWGERTLRPKAELAFQGGGEQCPGDWCRFCKIKATCGSLAATALRAKDLDPRLLADDEIATRILPFLPAIKLWLSAVEDHVLQRALEGGRFKGYKLVEGRSVRKITDQKKAGEALAMYGYMDDTVWKPSELKSITELEKALGRNLFNEILGDFVSKPAGKPMLVPESDKRPEYRAADDFANMDFDF